MLRWYLRQRFVDKLAVGLFALAMTPILWTALASRLFIHLMGAWMRQEFPFSDPDSYWQWWAYLFDDDQPKRVHLWLAVAGVAAAAPVVAFIARQVLDTIANADRPALYGKTVWADRKQTKAANILTSKKPF